MKESRAYTRLMRLLPECDGEGCYHAPVEKGGDHPTACEGRFWTCHNRSVKAKAIFAIGRRVCAVVGHLSPMGSYGSNDAWCFRCGACIGGPPRAGEYGW